MTLEQLRARLNELRTQMQAIVDAADSNLTEDQAAEFDKLKAERETVAANIDRLEGLEAANADDDAPRGRTTPAPTPRVEGGETRQDPNCGFADIAEFGRAVMVASGGPNRSEDPRLAAMYDVQGAPTNFHRETSSDDGYQVPPAMRDIIMELVFESDELINRVDSEPTNSNSVELIADESTPWGSTGIQAYWGSEGSQFTPSRLDTDGRQVKLHKLHAFVTATEELLEDAPRLGDRLSRGAARAINWKANDALFYGTGAGQPLGFANASSLVTQAKETSQTADTVNAANVSKMFSRLLSGSIGRAEWHVNSDVLPQLFTMTIGDQPVWMPNFREAPGGVLLGRPVYPNEHCKTLGDAGDIVLLDPMGYYLARKEGGVKFGSSIHLYFDYDVQAFKWTFRLGGQPHLSAAVSPANGSSTKSHFVNLAARA